MSHASRLFRSAKKKWSLQLSESKFRPIILSSNNDTDALSTELCEEKRIVRELSMSKVG